MEAVNQFGFLDAYKAMADKPVYSSVGRLYAIITILPAGMAAGGLLGYFVIDRWFGIFPWGTMAFLFIGAGAGFFEIFKILTADRGEHSENKGH